MPTSCEFLDLTQVLSYNHNIFSRFNKAVKNAELISIKVLTEKYNYLNDSNFYILM